MGTEPVRVDDSTKEQIEEYHEETDTESLAEAADEVATVGLREMQGPILHKAREMALDVAVHLAAVAAITIVVGLMTTALSAPHAVAIAITILAIGVVPVAAVETIRAIRGQSELGDWIRNGGIR